VKDINKVRGWASVWLLSLRRGIPSREISQQKKEYLMAATWGYTCTLMEMEYTKPAFLKLQK
jgi:hypothetical protein